MTSAVSRRKYGKNRLLRGLKRNQTKSSNGHFTSPSWYPEVPILDLQGTIITLKTDLKARGVIRETASMARAPSDDVYTANFCHYLWLFRPIAH